MSSKKCVLLLLICLLLLSISLSVRANSIPRIDASYLRLSLTGLQEDGGSFSPVAGLTLNLALWRWALGVESLYQDEGLQRNLFYLQHRLKEPLGDLTYTFFQVGFVSLSYLDTFEEYTGIYIGTNLTRFFNQRWSAHTNLHLTYIPGNLIPSFETGFKYYFSPFWSFDFNFRGYDLDRYGFTVGTTLYR